MLLSEKKRMNREHEPKLFYFKRNGRGEKVVVLSGKRHGKKITQELTQKQMNEAFEKA